MKLFSALGVGVLAVAAVSGVAAAGTKAADSPSVEVSPADQTRYEAELVTFLESNPRPESGQFDYSTAGRNDYWRAMADWWDRVPWEAVAGQWGCASGSAGATFNPPDQRGVITAGYGGMINCGSTYDGPTIALLTEPVPRSEVDLPE